MQSENTGCHGFLTAVIAAWFSRRSPQQPVQRGDTWERLSFPLVGSSLQVWGRNPPADGRGILAQVEGSIGGTPHSWIQRVVLALPPVPAGRVSVWCWSRFALRADVFWGELHRRKCVHVRDVHFSPWEKRDCLLSIVVTC